MPNTRKMSGKSGPPGRALKRKFHGNRHTIEQTPLVSSAADKLQDSTLMTSKLIQTGVM